MKKFKERIKAETKLVSFEIFICDFQYHSRHKKMCLYIVLTIKNDMALNDMVFRTINLSMLYDVGKFVTISSTKSCGNWFLITSQAVFHQNYLFVSF